MKRMFVVSLVLLVSLSLFFNINSYAGEISEPMQLGPLAPDVVVLDPKAEIVVVNSKLLPFRILVLSRALPLTSVTITINGKVFAKERLEKETGETRRRFSKDYPLPLQEGPNVIEVTASNEKASSRPEVRKVTYTPSMSNKPNLVVLSIGISGYRESQLDQPQASRNAVAFAKLLASQDNTQGLYEAVKPQVVTDKAASRIGVLKGLAWLNSEARSDADVRVLFLSGAFLGDYSENTYFLSSDHDVKTDPEISSLSLRMMFARLASAPGPVLVFMDSISFSLGGMRRALRQLHEYSLQGNFFVYVCCEAKDPSGISLTSESVFMNALFEGLKGKAVGNDGVIDTRGLSSWLESSVPSLSGGFQHPLFLGNSKALTVFRPITAVP